MENIKREAVIWFVSTNKKFLYQKPSFFGDVLPTMRLTKMSHQTEPSNLVSQNIKAHLEESGESLSAFAEKAQLSKSTISRIISSPQQHEINVRTLKKIANAIGLPPDAFIEPDGLISFESTFHKASFIENPFSEGREVYNKALNRALGRSSSRGSRRSTPRPRWRCAAPSVTTA